MQMATQAFRNAMVGAKNVSDRYRHSFVGCLHILLSMLESSDTARAVFGKSCEVSVLLGQLDTALHDAISGSARQAILHASTMQVAGFQPFPDVPHLIAALLDHPDPELSAFLHNNNLDVKLLKSNNRETAQQPSTASTSVALDQIVAGESLLYTESIDAIIRRLAEIMPPDVLVHLLVSRDRMHRQQELDSFRELLQKALADFEASPLHRLNCRT